MISLYVCLFSNGHLKVGRSVNALARISQHEERVSCLLMRPLPPGGSRARIARRCSPAGLRAGGLFLLMASVPAAIRGHKKARLSSVR